MLGYYAPQMCPAIAGRKSRLEKKLRGARVSGTQHVTIFNYQSRDDMHLWHSVQLHSV
jgi:hypothetical protein